MKQPHVHCLNSFLIALFGDIFGQQKVDFITAWALQTSTETSNKYYTVHRQT